MESLPLAAAAATVISGPALVAVASRSRTAAARCGTLNFLRPSFEQVEKRKKERGRTRASSTGVLTRILRLQIPQENVSQLIIEMN